MNLWAGFQPALLASVMDSKAHIGTDESGKGDYFGPLVVAAVCVDAQTAALLTAAGVRDSKKVSDSRAAQLARDIKGSVPHAVVVIGPEKYNELYEKIRNLNKLLAWAHARVIENLLDKVSCDTVVADKFGDERFIQNALLQKGRQVKLIQQVRAESDIAVAAASILARAEFLRRLADLSEKIGIDLPKGASSLVDNAGARVLRSGGEQVLGTVAKLHFKNTQKVRALVAGPDGIHRER